MNSDKVDLTTTLAGVVLANPVMPASGTWGSESEMLLQGPTPGAFVTKTVKLLPVQGNPTPRLYDTNHDGLLNAIGIPGKGLERFLKEDLPWLRARGRPFIINVSGSTVDDYAELAERLDGSGAAAIEANLGCPNVDFGLLFGQHPNHTRKVVSAMRKRTKLPLIVKLTPNVTNIVEIAIAAQKGGADALSMINTILGMDINVENGNSVLGNITGGFSGPAIRPVALRCVWQVCHCPDIKIPVIGMGGINDAEDAMKFLWAGAEAIAVGTANFKHPSTAMPNIITGISNWLASHRFASLKEWKETRNKAA